ncbi:Nramp family divalent metal transporter [Spongiibacter taiwanensis]|uniref:Nramp family divalent metal transporter n=1 Tax=Spongiibacter taiwanensis TaxID=1748242 RepID=UPI002035FB06|nr:Nramp family divalent metal transporter [Spongiibacter taiwanensis]USA42060.1 Nramp family divalent metal transporter [Spongiibacter taiwanensis]
MKPLSTLAQLGPGIVIAATGLGAGDMVTAAAAGTQFGSALLWAVALGALIKFGLNEGLARWQLCTGTSLLSGWNRHLPRWVAGYFFLYLLVWAFLVAAALMAACGLAAHTVFPALSINAWAAIQTLAAAGLIALGRYPLLETAMKVLIGLMFVTVLTAVAATDFEQIEILPALLPTHFPEDSLTMVLAVLGGVGGSLTLLCYGHWMNEKGWRSPDNLTQARVDLIAAYSLTALFAMGIMLLAAAAAPTDASGLGILLAMADSLGANLGSVFRGLFLAGFWAAVFSSMLGVWQGVPYLFADTLRQFRQRGEARGEVDTRGRAYRGFLLYMAVPPLLLLQFGKPVWLVLVYSVAGAFFMPFLALTLLYLNNRYLSGGGRNSIASNVLLLAGLLLFVVVALAEWW